MGRWVVADTEEWTGVKTWEKHLYTSLWGQLGGERLNGEMGGRGGCGAYGDFDFKVGDSRA